ncbi:hypothetical protein GC722_15770 [Auraticoccus sp. F435]|uniref:PQQ-binding-like beta-propeller repeat protein n=1 Tax=Auraticoccus cholistanensis TaxID=2656650 RepID=A0A6A9UZH4_9ACTN|nr:hypothetical protein [Auraticoccus cholistanensis]MVA77465.1 hypothetical protein [Auraticoccus cholistanensis]
MDVIDDDRDVLEAGRSPWGARLLTVVVAVVAVVLGLGRTGDPAPPPPPAPRVSTPPAPPVPMPSAPPPAEADPRPVELAGAGPVLPGGRGEVAWLRTARAVLAVDLGTGRVLRTPVRLPVPGGSSALIAGPDGVLVLDADPRRAGAAALVWGELPAGPAWRFGRSRTVLPGPGSSLYLADQPGEDRTRFFRVLFNGADLPGTVPAEGGRVTSDGRGGLLQEDRRGLWRLGEDGRTQLSTGRLLAVGPNHLLISECGPWHYCVQVLLDQRTGERRAVPGWPRDAADPGRISPDGRRVAVVVRGRDRAQLQLVATDRSWPVAVWDEQSALAVEPASTFAFSADGSSLLAVHGGRLLVVDALTGRSRPADLGQAEGERLLQLSLAPAQD